MVRLQVRLYLPLKGMKRGVDENHLTAHWTAYTQHGVCPNHCWWWFTDTGYFEGKSWRLLKYADLAAILHLSSNASSPVVCSGSCGEKRKERDARRVLERHKEVHEANTEGTLLLIQLFLHTLHISGILLISMAKFLAELLGCTLPDKGTPPLFEVRML